jgi:hypothetical protein
MDASHACGGTAITWSAWRIKDGAQRESVRRPVSRVLSAAQSGVATIHLGRRLRAASCGLPGCETQRRACPRTDAASLFGLAPGGACRAPFLAVGAVGSYPTVSPLPGRKRGPGGLISAALSLNRINRPAGISPAPCLRGARTFLSCGISPLAGAAARPPDSAHKRVSAGQVKGFIPCDHAGSSREPPRSGLRSPRRSDRPHGPGGTGAGRRRPPRACAG